MSTRLEVSCGRWVFTGDVPAALKGKSWGDTYAAVRAAERAGLECFANGSVRPFAEPAPCHDPDAEVNLCSDDDMRRSNGGED